MTPRGKKSDGDDGGKLPAAIQEDGYPRGDGPLWISQALGVPGCLRDATRILSDEGDETALTLHLTRSGEDFIQVIRPARLITTRRLAEQLGAIGFPVPYYQPPQLARIGQAIGRVADRALIREQVRSWEGRVSFLATWMSECLTTYPSYVLIGREGIDVRAAIEHGKQMKLGLAPFIIEPAQAVMSVWTVPVIGAVRERFGTTDDGDLGVKLRLAGLTHGRFAARPGPGERSTQEMPVWTVYNGWQGVEVEMPRQQRESGVLSLCPL